MRIEKFIKCLSMLFSMLSYPSYTDNESNHLQKDFSKFYCQGNFSERKVLAINPHNTSGTMRYCAPVVEARGSQGLEGHSA